MALKPVTTRARERIMSFGGAGLGKSYDFYTIARLALKTKSDAMFYVIDTDESAWRMLTDPAFADLLFDGEPLNIEVIEVGDFDELMKAMETINKKLRPQDWVMIDMMTPVWDWVQAKFTEKVFSKGLDDYFLQARSAQGDGAGNAFEGWKDWPVINSMYGRFTSMLLKCKGNLYCTAEQKKVNADTTEQDTKLLFSIHGFVPKGQKRDPHIFQTVLWKTADGNPSKPMQWQMTTVKDRSREMLKKKTINDFAKDYLVRTAGWKLA